MWPTQLVRRVSISAFEDLFIHFGYQICGDGLLEIGNAKVALFAKGGIPTHAAIQLENGQWSSKLGRNSDISHALDALEDGIYGQPVRFFRKARTQLKQPSHLGSRATVPEYNQ